MIAMSNGHQFRIMYCAPRRAEARAALCPASAGMFFRDIVNFMNFAPSTPLLPLTIRAA
jgi:hypothetical protein